MNTSSQVKLQVWQKLRILLSYPLISPFGGDTEGGIIKLNLIITHRFILHETSFPGFCLV